MSKASKEADSDFDDSEIFSEEGFDASEFVDTMETKTSQRKTQRGQLSIRRLLDDRQEARRLRDCLQDWDDWDKDSQDH